MSTEQPSKAQVCEWTVMSLEDGFHAYDTTSGLKWPPEGSQPGLEVRHVWRDGWNSSPEPKRGFFRRALGATRRHDEKEFRRAHFLWTLSRGQAEAIGYLLPRSGNDRAVLIPQEGWEHADLDWESGTLSGAGLRFAHVRILMPERSALLENGIYTLEPMPDLDVFEPSESVRRMRGIPALADAADAADASERQPSPSGRPSRRQAIIEAFHQVEKDPAWSQKALANAIREQVKSNSKSSDENGLSKDSILRHVADSWEEFKRKS